jgi:alpha-N-arabinofuranosidase
MYKVHQGATLLSTDINCVPYEHGDASIPAISVSASRNDEGQVHLSLCNLNPGRKMSVSCELRGMKPTSATGRVLTAEAINTHNTFDHPESVKPATFNGMTLTNNTLLLDLPAKSIVVLEIQ